MKKIISLIGIMGFLMILLSGCGGPSYGGVSMTQLHENELEKLIDKTNTLTDGLKTYISDKESIDNTSKLENIFTGFKNAANDTFGFEPTEENVPNFIRYDFNGKAVGMDSDHKIAINNAIVTAVSSLADNATSDKKAQKKIITQFNEDTHFESKLDNLPK